MANAKRCDMCGKYYELYKTCYDSNGNTINGFRFFFDHLDITKRDPRKSYDCCPTCLGLLLKIIKEKRKDGGLE